MLQRDIERGIRDKDRTREKGKGAKGGGKGYLSQRDREETEVTLLHPCCRVQKPLRSPSPYAKVKSL